MVRTRAASVRTPRSSADANLIIETVIGPLWFRLILTAEPLTDAIADHVAELVAVGAMRS